MKKEKCVIGLGFYFGIIQGKGPLYEVFIPIFSIFAKQKHAFV